MLVDLKVHPHAVEIIKALRAHGEEAYVVGGAVRDLLLGGHPKDYDLATSATPEKVKMVFGGKARIIGKRFRLVHVQMGRETFEVSTFRRKPDDTERKGRESDQGEIIWRDNFYGSLEEDAFRRDYTVNALYYDPLKRELIDFVDGFKDLNTGIVRAIGPADERLGEDPVRMIRALKLAAQYNLQLEHDLDKALKQRAGEILLASRARLFDELVKILQKPYSAKTFEALQKYGLLKFLLPAFSREWRNDCGEQTLSLLRRRDAKVATGNYSDSRILALGTMMFFFVQKRLQRRCGEQEFVWQFSDGMEGYFRETVFRFFAELSIPKFLRLRLTTMMLALPRFLQGKKRQLLMQNLEYRYARELFALIVDEYGLDEQSYLANWPMFSSSNHLRKRNKRRRPRPRRRKNSPE